MAGEAHRSLVLFDLGDVARVRMRLLLKSLVHFNHALLCLDGALGEAALVCLLLPSHRLLYYVVDFVRV